MALGGAGGTLARWLLGRALPSGPPDLPWTTLGVNITGAFLLGALVVVTDRAGARPWVRPLLGTGVLGGFTTFSTLAVDAVHLTRQHRAGTAAVALGLSLVLGILAAAAGAWVGRRSAPRPVTAASVRR